MTIIQITLFLVFFLIVVGLIFLIRAMQIPARVKKAEELLENDDHSKANEIVKAILEKKNDYAPARYLKAKILIKQKQYILAISELNSILSLPEFQKHVSELEIHNKLAELYNETKQYPKEIEEYRLILGFLPDDINANHRLGHSLFKQKKYREARDRLLKAYTISPSLTDCILPLGISYYYSADYDSSEKHLLKAVEMPQGSFEANFYLGMIFKGKKDFDTAIRMFETSKKDAQYFIKSLFHLGEIYFENALYDDAIKSLEQGIGGIKKGDDEALAYRYLLAECYVAINMIKEAVHHWEQISNVNSNYRSTKIKLDEYQAILNNENLKTIFTSSLNELQPLLTEVISGMNYNIVSKKEISHNEYMFRAYNIKRTNEPPILIYFNRTTKEITEGQIISFQKMFSGEKCKSGMYITTSNYSLRAKSAASSRMIELIDTGFLKKSIEKIKRKFKSKT